MTNGKGYSSADGDGNTGNYCWHSHKARVQACFLNTIIMLIQLQEFL